jgi:hypothetical protein
MTNQLQTVSLGNFGTFQIYQITEMGDAQQIMDIGNKIRKANGRNKITLESVLQKQSFWEFAIAYYNRMMQKELEKHEFSDKNRSSVTLDPSNAQTSGFANSSVTLEYKIDPFIHIDLEDYKGKNRKIKYSDLVKKFPKLIQTKKGKGGHTYMNLYLLIKLATQLDADLEVQIYEIFIRGRYLEIRDEGGEQFKRLNILIDLLPDRVARAKEKNTTVVLSNKRVYRNTATKMNKKVNGSFDGGWNDERKELIGQERRLRLERTLCDAMEQGWIDTLPTLNKAIDKFRF